MTLAAFLKYWSAYKEGRRAKSRAIMDQRVGSQTSKGDRGEVVQGMSTTGQGGEKLEPFVVPRRQICMRRK